VDEAPAVGAGALVDDVAEVLLPPPPLVATVLPDEGALLPMLVVDVFLPDAGALLEDVLKLVLAEPPVADWPDEKTDAPLTTVLRVERTLLDGGTEGTGMVVESLMSAVLPIGANRKLMTLRNRAWTD